MKKSAVQMPDIPTLLARDHCRAQRSGGTSAASPTGGRRGNKPSRLGKNSRGPQASSRAPATRPDERPVTDVRRSRGSRPELVNARQRKDHAGNRASQLRPRYRGRACCWMGLTTQASIISPPPPSIAEPDAHGGLMCKAFSAAGSCHVQQEAAGDNGCTVGSSNT